MVIKIWGVPLATEGTVRNDRKRGGDSADNTSEPAVVKGRLANVTWSHVDFDVCELFSQPRVVDVAEELGLRGGYPLDRAWVDKVTGFLKKNVIKVDCGVCEEGGLRDG